MPDHFSVKDRGWADWADQFDMASEVNWWSNSRKLKMMALIFVGKAREVYWGLAPEAHSSLHMHLYGRLWGDTWGHAIKLIGTVQSCIVESVVLMSTRDFGNVIQRLVDKAYPSVDLPTRDMLAKNQYIAKIGSGDIRMQLRSAKPINLEAAIELASELEQIKTLKKKETVAVLNVFSDEAQANATAPSMQAELHKLQQEVCELRAMANRPNIGRDTRSNFPPPSRGWGRPTSDVLSRACWECGCNRHLHRDCLYVQGNASGWQ